MSADTLLRDLISDCEDPTSYPTKLRHTQLLPHSLQRHHEHLKEREVDVFEDDPEYWRIRFLDCYDGEEQFPLALKDCFAVQDLREYLLDGLNKLDPKCRHVFLEATHAQAPLDCSREMLVLLFTFHQVMPQFLDILLSFGRRPGRNVPVAFHHCIFRFEHFMDLSPRRFEIPQLGRSGLEIRHCYNLWAAEKSLPERGHKNKHPWAVRQAGLYHSFDVKTGRATWIHIKANDMIQKRIKQATDQAERFQPKSLETVEGSFAATLLTHLVMIEWCGESWAQYLSYWECQIEEILTRVKSAQIADVEKDILGDFSYIPPIANRSVSFQTPSRRGTGVVCSRSVRTPSRKNTVMTTNSATITNLPTRLLARVKSGLVGSAALAQSNSPELPVSRPGFETNNVQANEDAALKIFDEFKFLDLQRLHGFGDRLQEADMILGLNLDIVSEIIEYYKSYVQDPETPEFIRKGCRSDLSHFVQRASGIVRELRTEKTRITTLLALLEDGKAIFEAITQLRNIELNRRASKRMEEMTEDMHQLTLQTKRDTSSMHLITGVTLVFLPGTFVAVRYALPALWNLFFSSSCLTTSNDQTFLGAGFYQWPEAPDGSGADGIAKFPVFRPRYFSLFLAISLVLTVITLLIWWGRIWLAPRATNWWRDVRGLQKEKDEEALDSAPKVEKSP